MLEKNVLGGALNMCTSNSFDKDVYNKFYLRYNHVKHL